jgi:hypothetical protein
MAVKRLIEVFQATKERHGFRLSNAMEMKVVYTVEWRNMETEAL